MQTAPTSERTRSKFRGGKFRHHCDDHTNHASANVREPRQTHHSIVGINEINGAVIMKKRRRINSFEVQAAAAELTQALMQSICPRCGTNRIDRALLGTEAEGHICGDCWQQDRAAEQTPTVMPRAER